MTNGCRQVYRVRLRGWPRPAARRPRARHRPL